MSTPFTWMHETTDNNVSILYACCLTSSTLPFVNTLGLNTTFLTIDTSTVTETINWSCSCCLIWDRRIGIYLLKLYLNTCSWLECKIMFTCCTHKLSTCRHHADYLTIPPKSVSRHGGGNCCTHNCIPSPFCRLLNTQCWVAWTFSHSVQLSKPWKF